MEEVNYIKHLNGVFHRFYRDGRLNPSHIGLYMALFQIWNHNYFKEEFHINREEVMAFSKIGSKSTYHRCIKQLSHWGYILYIPSHNPFKGSRIRMFDFGTSAGQVVHPSRPDNGTSSAQAVVPFNKQIHTLKNNENNKRQDFRNRSANGAENGCGQTMAVPNGDNLKTTINKDYNEPL